MRHDWTLLCTEVQVKDTGTIDLGNVFSTLQVRNPFNPSARAEHLIFDPPAILLSQWTVEFDSDQRLHTAIVQLVAPGGDRILWGDELEFDLRGKAIFHMIYLLNNLPLVGKGIYEFHVYLKPYGPIGEWGRTCLTIG